MTNPTPDQINRRIAEAMGKSPMVYRSSGRSRPLIYSFDPYHNPAHAVEALEWWRDAAKGRVFDRTAYILMDVFQDPANRYAVEVSKWPDGDRYRQVSWESKAPTLSAAISLALHEAIRADND